MSLRGTYSNGRGGLSRVLALSLAMCMLLSLAVPFQAGGIPDPYSFDAPEDIYEADDYPHFAKEIRVNAPPQSRTIHEMDNADWVKFDVVEGATYIVRSTVPGSVGVINGSAAPEALTDVTGDYDDVPVVMTSLELFDQSGQSLLAWAYPEGPMATSRIVWTAQSTGYLYARVSSVASSHLGGIADNGEPDVAGELADPLGDIFLSSPFTGQYLLSVVSGRQEVRGEVRADDTGDPLGGVNVMLWRWENPPSPRNNEPPILFETISAADGSYFFDHLPSGYYQVEAYPYDMHCMPYGYDWEEFWLPDERIADMGVNLWLPPAAAAGKVVNESGEGLANIRVAISYWSGSFWNYWGTAYTGPTGCWKYSHLQTGTQYRFQFMDNSLTYAEQWYDGVSDPDSATVLPEGGDYDGSNPMHGVNATLTVAPALISGTVTDARGEPLANHRVVALSQTAQQLWEAYTDSEGKYTIRELLSREVSDTVKVHFDDFDGKHVPEWYDDTMNDASATVLPIASGTPVTGIDASLADTPPYLVGRVTDEVTGEPIEGVEVWLYAESRRVYRATDYTRTDEDGWYSFNGYLGLANDNSVQNIDPAHKLRFYDPSQTYASEYWDDQPTLGDADEIPLFTLIPGSSADISFETDDSPMPPQVPRAFVADAELSMKVARSTGIDRYQSAINVAEDQFPNWDELADVIVASGEDRSASDALAAAGLSWLYDAPILLTSSQGPSPELLEAIGNMGSEVDLHVVGGTAAVSAAAADEILALDNVNDQLDRIWGEDRYGTAAAIAELLYFGGDEEGFSYDSVFLANGSDWDRFWDALALSAPTANTGIPILLVTEDSIPEATAEVLDGAEPEDVYIAGGSAAVDPVVMDELIAEGFIVERWWGTDRYGTAVDVAEGSIARGWLGYATVGVAGKVPDAMAGGAAVGRQGGPLLLTRTDSLPAATEQFLSLNRQWINKCTVLGGPAAVSEQVRDEITLALD